MLADRDLIAINDLDSRQPLSPFIRSSQKFNGNGPSHGISCCGYDIRLSDEFICYINSSSTIDPTDETFKNIQNWTHPTIKKNKFCLNPGHFVLAASQEIFSMPDNLSAEVKDKSTLARLGVAVQNTLIEPGFVGRLTLEITNHGSSPVVLTAGMGIAQIVFHKLNTRPITTYWDRNGKYLNQGVGSDPAVTLPR